MSKTTQQIEAMIIEKQRNVLFMYNKHRRGTDFQPALDQHEIGKAIDFAIEVLDKKIVKLLNS
jgi:hypothetical protein